MLRFFKFYGYEFDFENRAVDIRSGREPYPLRSDVLREIHRTFERNPDAADILSQNYIARNDEYWYMVVDPFKIDYSPAKIRVISEEAEQYSQQFRSAYVSIKKGQLPI